MSWEAVDHMISNVEIEQATKELIMDATEHMEHIASRNQVRGTLSGNIIESINQLTTPPQLSWTQLVSKQLSRYSKNYRETIHRFNRRTPKTIHKKGRIRNQQAKIVVAIDTSGSMSNEKELAIAFHELYHLVKQRSFDIEFMQFDTVISSKKAITHKNDFKFQVTGRGGTAFQPVFDEILADKYNKQVPVIIFTDGYGEYAIDTHGYDNVQWILIDRTSKLSVQNPPGKERFLLPDKKKVVI